MLNPLMVAVTAHFRVAPIAIRTIDVPMVMAHRLPCSGGYIRHTACVPPRTIALSPRLPQLTLDVPGHLPLADRFALVVEILAPGERNLDLGPRARAGEVDPRRHQRQAPLVRAPDQPLDLGAVHEQLARALGVVVFACCGTVGRDVEADQPYLPIADDRVGILQLG